MKNKNSPIFIALGVLVVIIIILLYVYNSRTKKYSWYENYASKNEQPYQVKYIKKLLPTIYPDKTFKEIRFPAKKYLDTVTVPTNYIYIGDELYLNDTDKESFLSFVEKGNVAFISTKEFPIAFNDSLFINSSLAENYYYNVDTLYNPSDSVNIEEQFNEEFGYTDYYDSIEVISEDTIAYRYFWNSSLSYSYNSFSDTGVSVNFTHPNLKAETPYYFNNIFADTVSSYYWRYINTDKFAQQPDIIGTYKEGKTNFIRFKYGDGYIYLHTLPKLFTNYYLLDKKGYEYTKKVFGHLKPGAILYDDYNRYYHSDGNDNYSNENKLSESPLHYILSQKSFRWTWYLLLIMGLLYMLFKAKREQRVIPVIIPNTNSSLEFIKTIGTIYLNEKNHKRLVYQEMNLFLSHIRNRYRLPTKELDDTLIKQIALLSEIEERRVRFIFKKFKDLSNQSVISDDELIKFYKAMRYFYKHSK